MQFLYLLVHTETVSFLLPLCTCPCQKFLHPPQTKRSSSLMTTRVISTKHLLSSLKKMHFLVIFPPGKQFPPWGPSGRHQLPPQALPLSAMCPRPWKLRNRKLEKDSCCHLAAPVKRSPSWLGVKGRWAPTWSKNPNKSNLEQKFKLIQPGEKTKTKPNTNPTWSTNPNKSNKSQIEKQFQENYRQHILYKTWTRRQINSRFNMNQ